AQAADAAGLGARPLRNRAHGRQFRGPAARQDRGRSRRSQAHRDGARGGLSLQPLNAYNVGMFSFERNERDGVTVLALHGNLDAATAAGLKQEVVAIAEAKKTRVAVDMSKLTLIDSTGVGVLISLFKRTRAQGGAAHF